MLIAYKCSFTKRCHKLNIGTNLVVVAKKNIYLEMARKTLDDRGQFLLYVIC